MIEFETVRFIKMLDELAKLSKNEIIPFREMTSIREENHICYDENSQNSNGTYKIPLEMCLICDHHDIICYYDDYVKSDDVIIGVSVDECDNSKFVSVVCLDSDYSIVIQNGEWYFS